MIKRDWTPQDINQVYFPVKLCPLRFSKPGSTEWLVARNLRAVVDIERDHVFAAVSDKYRIIENQDAVNAANPIVKEIFKRGLSDFECFNIIMPKSRSSCQIDLILRDDAQDRTYNPFNGDPWTVFVRISNSYNRTKRLRFEMGFCRWICLNGMIFGRRSIDFTFAHDETILHDQNFLQKAANEAHLKFGSLLSLRDDFTKKLRMLRDLKISKEWAIPLFCKFFKVSLNEVKFKWHLGARNQNQYRLYGRMAGQVRQSVEDYFTEMGYNAYAMLNVLSDYASHPSGALSQANVIPTYQRRVGEWLDEFPTLSQESGFTFDNYIGEDAKQSAVWLMKYAS